MTDRQRQLLADIEYAFAGVELGAGVGMRETEVIDSYGSDYERLAARAQDEKHDWRKLVHDPDLTKFFSIAYGGFVFLDAAGVRFHLPACLARVVKDSGALETDDMLGSLLYMLTDTSDFYRDRLAILDDRQRECVCEVLLYLRDDPAYNEDIPDECITDYWSRPAD